MIRFPLWCNCICCMQCQSDTDSCKSPTGGQLTTLWPSSLSYIPFTPQAILCVCIMHSYQLQNTCDLLLWCQLDNVYHLHIHNFRWGNIHFTCIYDSHISIYLGINQNILDNNGIKFHQACAESVNVLTIGSRQTAILTRGCNVKVLLARCMQSKDK